MCRTTGVNQFIPDHPQKLIVYPALSLMERSLKKQVKSDASSKPKNLVFFHPDLGIGGAERLVVDAAVGLQNLGHKVTIFTSHCDPTHCFDEARDGTLDVRVRGNTIFPATILGRFQILFSILRQLHLLCAITWTGELAKLKPTAFFIDQLSAGIPFLRWFWEDVKILFYCHFPDLLLVQNRKSWYKRIWRIPFDLLEGWGIRGADRVVANSGFTKGVAEGIWNGLGGERGVGVVYPCVDTTEKQIQDGSGSGDQKGQDLWKHKKVLLSINRFDRRKDVALAIKAFAGLTDTERDGVRLVIAGMIIASTSVEKVPCSSFIGGYDTRVSENVTCLKELESLANSLKLKAATAKNIVSAQAIPDNIEVLFLLSVPAQLKASLLHTAKLLLYTPSDEHFGIVPLEAMLAGVPVLAANNGGPLETVLDPETGWLRSVDRVDQWKDVMHQVLYEMPETTLKQTGENGMKRVKDEFSEVKMAHRLDEELDTMIKATRQEATEIADVAMALILYVAALAMIGFVALEARRTDVPDLFSIWQISLGTSLVAASLLMMGAVTWKLMQNESAFR